MDGLPLLGWQGGPELQVGARTWVKPEPCGLSCPACSQSICLIIRTLETYHSLEVYKGVGCYLEGVGLLGSDGYQQAGAPAFLKRGRV